MPKRPTPTERELEILKILWKGGEASVREVYEKLRQRLPIVQNTVQAFLRTTPQVCRERAHASGSAGRPTTCTW